MARARRSRAPTLVLALLLFGALAAGASFLLQKRHESPAPNTTTGTPVLVSAEHVDPANEGRKVVVSGRVNAVKPARDPQLGISADAIALMRGVEMLQWREKCMDSRCDYAMEWSGKPIDSHTFRDPEGHANPAHFPFGSERFFAEDLRLGAFKVDPALIAAASEAVAFPVRAAQLPPNLAATFRDRDGALYASADAAHAVVGDLRVSYRIVPGDTRRVTGIQRGDRLDSTPAR
jgi:hypothetical protein